MNNLFPSRLSLAICILMGAIPAQDTSADGPDKLSPCPDSPNCVSSQSTDEAHFIEPLHYSGRTVDARQKLIDILESIDRVQLVKVERDFIHAEFRSSVFRFVDDVKFWFPPDKPIIQVKSASRTGYYDFGANRRRVERLWEAFNKYSPAGGL